MADVWAVSIIALWVFFLFTVVLLIGILRQIGLINLRLGPDQGALLITDVGLDRGTRVPDFEAIDTASKQVVRLYDLPSVPRVLAFVTTTCMSCRAVLEGLNEVAATRRTEFDFLVVCHDNVDSCAGLAELANLRVRTVADPSGRALEAFNAAMTPFVYLVDAEGRVLIRGVANDWRGVESLLNEEGTLQGAHWTEISESEAEEAQIGG